MQVLQTNLEIQTGLISARLDRLPATRTVWTRVILLSLGGFFEFYDLFFTGYIAPGLVRSHILTTTGIAGFIAAMFSGLFVGTALFGFVADRLGRRTIFTGSLLWYSVASVVMAFQNHVFGLDLWRFLAGIGVGVELVTIDTYLAELVPKQWRGRAFAYNQTIQFSAVPMVALLAWLLVPRSPLGLDGWRWVVLIGAAGAIFVWWIRLRVPESLRWLAQHGRMEEAERLLADLEAGLDLPPPAAPATPTSRGSFREVWKPPYRRRTLMLIVFQLFQTVGFYGFSNWVPTLLIGRGIAITSSLRYTFLIAIAAPLGPLLASAIADKIERKWQIVLAALGIAFFGVLFGQLDNIPTADCVGRAGNALGKHTLVFLARVPGRALPDADSRHGGGVHLFLEPVLRDLQFVRNRFLPRSLRRSRRIRIYRGKHGDRHAVDRMVRTEDE